MSSWGRFKVSFDSWTLISLDNHVLEESAEIGDVNVETSNWRPITPSVSEKDLIGIKVGFVDGVRRTENIVYIEDPSESLIVEGAFVSIGAGALILTYGKPNALDESLRFYAVERYLLLRDMLSVSELTLRFPSPSGVIEFKVQKTNKELSPYVNELMSELEQKIALMALESVHLLITDGTLHRVAKNQTLPFIGYVKKHRKLYVYPEHIPVLRHLKPFQRTPIVLIHSRSQEGKDTEVFDKLTWYVKLNNSDGITSLARLEVPAGIGLEKARKIADITARLLPHFASTEFNDKRAPQNLIPIKYLENFLRRRLGSQALIRRLIAHMMLR
ncbi:MAG: DNA double-strand break repair nuclease NurA [Aquificae bacterium]|nr:DNA double-strand break repair nuclease NurA [Aquificota bacterium]